MKIPDDSETLDKLILVTESAMNIYLERGNNEMTTRMRMRLIELREARDRKMNANV